jgi:hypothetical protein
LKLTRKGKRIMGLLAGDHARELNELAPRLAQALEHITVHAQARAGAEGQ